MHRIIPQHIIENYRAGRLQGEFKAVSMYLDISGFSVMTDTLMGQGRDGAEVLANTMRRVFDPVVDAVFDQGGMIVGFAGDSISAVFAFGSDRLSAAQAAVTAARQIQQGLRSNNRFDSAFGTFSVAAKIGLACGDVSWGILRSEQGTRATFYYRGEAIDESARAEQECGKGEIILTAPLGEILGPYIETGPLGDLLTLERVPGLPCPPHQYTPPPPDPDAASLFFPAEILTQEVPGEFRQTVHLAIGLPDLSESQIPDFMETFFGLQATYGGLPDRIDFGDKGCNMIVVWGAPKSHENDIDRALGFALDLRRRLPFAITAGITYYGSFAGYVGGQRFETYAAYGWGISLAVRFMTDAPRGELWIDERIAARARPRFDLEHRGARAFKGFAQKQNIYRLLGRKAEAGLSYSGRMVGREPELSALAGFVAPLWKGRYAGVTAIWGEAGMGKSRLVHEFMQSVVFQEHPCVWAICQTDEILRRPLNPFRYWLSQYFALLPHEDPSRQIQKIRGKIDDLIALVDSATAAADLRKARAFLAPLVGLEWPDAIYEHLDAQGRYDSTINALITILTAESRRQPVILLVEDAQFLDEDSQAFIPRLKRALAADPVPHPVAILMTTRWEGTKVLLEEALVDNDVDLAALPDSSVAAMAEDILGRPAAWYVVRLVNERAEGIPFYAEQIFRYLKEGDLLVMNSSGEWSLPAENAAEALPADIRAMLVSRLDKLPPRVKQVIQAAAVLGRVFDAPVVRSMLAAEKGIDSELAAAEHAGIWSALSETRYIFSHQLLRDVAYNMQLHSRRQDMHGRAFETLRESFGNERHRHHGALAYHSEQAGRQKEARYYLTRAAESARDGYHIVQALGFYARALALLPGTDLEDDYRLRRERERIIAEHGTLEQRLEELEAMQSLADRLAEPGKLAEVTLIRARLMASRGYYDRSAEAARRAQTLATEAGRDDVALGAVIALQESAYQRGHYQEAIERGEEAIILARTGGTEAEPQATILNKLGLTYMEMKNPSAARTYFEQSLALFREADDVRGVARVLTNLGSVASYNGNYSAALESYEQALRLAREFGSRKGECILLGNTAWVSGLLGEYDAARRYAERGLQIAREIGERLSETFCLIHISAQDGARGDFLSARDYAERALELARHSGQQNLQAWALTYLGHALHGTGLTGEAASAYAQAVEIRQRLDQPLLATEPASALARIALEDGDTARALQHVEPVLTQLEQDGTLEGTDHPLRVYLNCYLVLRQAGDGRARALLNSARDMLRMRANGIADPARRRAFLENIPHNREILALWQDLHQRD